MIVHSYLLLLLYNVSPPFFLTAVPWVLTAVALLKVQGVMGKSVEIMQVMNNLINIPELSKTMQDMAREMEKAGLVDEIVGETFEALDVSYLHLCRCVGLVWSYLHLCRCVGLVWSYLHLCRCVGSYLHLCRCVELFAPLSLCWFGLELFAPLSLCWFGLVWFGLAWLYFILT